MRGAVTCEVEDYQCHVCVFEVAGNETFETLLSSCVPELQADYFPAGCDVFAYEINPDRWLSHPACTFLVGSN
jgi:hypothetical protein